MKWLLGIIAIVLLVLGGYFGLPLVTKSSAPHANATERPAPEAAALVKKTRAAPEGMKEYRNEQYQFSILVPDSVVVVERNEGQGAISVTLEDRAAEVGFQIFVVPFLEQQISEERFRMDIPTGIRRETKDIAIDGAVGASFYSVHELLGETSEVWFVKNGYLYEVTTLKDLDQWLSGIMTTWEFTEE